MSDFTIVSFEKKRKNRDFFTPDAPDHVCYLARLTLGENSISVSQYDDEDYWAVDSWIGPNGVVHWSNGRGSRLVAEIRTISDSELISDLESAKAEAKSHERKW